MHERQEVRSLKKALRTLEYINAHGDATVTEVSKELKLPRTTAHRLLETFVVEGYLEREPHSGNYGLTSAVLRLAGGFREEEWLRDVARPLIMELGRELAWPVALCTPRLDSMVVRVATDHDTTMVIERYTAGFYAPMLHTTSGMCYLAHCSASEREATLAIISKSDDERQALVHQPETLANTLERTRADGYCIIEHPQYREGSVAVPVALGTRMAAGLIMRYIKHGLRPARIVADYVPKLAAVAAEIDLRWQQSARPRG